MLNMKAHGIPEKSSKLTMFAAKTVKFLAGANVSGVLYAPDAEVTVNGGFDWYGMVVGNNITISGGPGLHIDESLLQPSGGSGAYVTAWTEVKPRSYN